MAAKTPIFARDRQGLVPGVNEIDRYKPEAQGRR